MTEPEDHGEGAEHVERIERRWAAFAIALIALLVVTAAVAGIHQASMPQLRFETADPRTLHLAGEFIESNLGSSLESDGSVTVRAIGQQYSFTPQCILVPTDTPVTIRATSSDVVHGFLVEGTNSNTMLVPGYIATIPMRFSAPGEHHLPCHEFCGMGHEGMWGNIVAIDKQEFLRRAKTERRLDCVK